jgi:hypothetical protein
MLTDQSAALLREQRKYKKHIMEGIIQAGARDENAH